MRKLIACFAIGIMVLSGVSGCNSCRPRLCQGRFFKGRLLHRFQRQPAQPVTAQPLPPGSQFPGPPPSSAQFPTQPPNGQFSAPPNGQFSAPPDGQFPSQPPSGVPQIDGNTGGQVIPPAIDPDVSQYGPDGPKQVEYRWVPGDTPAQKPAPLPPETKEPPSATLIPPIFPPEKKKQEEPDQPIQPEPKKPEPKKPETPKKKEEPVSPFPVGIPQYSPVREGIASGLRPLLDDGLDWLNRSEFKTVLHIHKPGAPDTGDKQQVEKRGMNYIALEVSPDKLSKEVVDQFNKIVSDDNNRPLFVYDRDGSLAGGLWYLYFRTHEQMSDDVARIRASGLGFHENQPGSHQDMWRAVQKYMEKN